MGELVERLRLSAGDRRRKDGRPLGGRPSVRATSWLALALTTAVLIGCGGGGSSSVSSVAAPDSTAKDSSSARSGTSPGDLGRQLAVLRGPREPRDDLPPALAGKVETILQIDPSASRYARKVAGKPAYLVPTRKMTCLFSANEAIGSCWGSDAVRAGTATSTALCGPGLPAHRIATFGIARDWVERVTLLRNNTPDVTVPVEGNLYVAISSSQPPLPARLALEGQGRRVVQATGLPPAIVKAGCEAPTRDVDAGGRKPKPYLP